MSWPVLIAVIVVGAALLGGAFIYGFIIWPRQQAVQRAAEQRRQRLTSYTETFKFLHDRPPTISEQDRLEALARDRVKATRPVIEATADQPAPDPDPRS